VRIVLAAAPGAAAARAVAGPPGPSGRGASDGGGGDVAAAAAWTSLLLHLSPPAGPLYHAASDPRTGPVWGGASAAVAAAAAGAAAGPPSTSSVLPSTPLAPTPAVTCSLAAGILAAHWPVAFERARAWEEGAADAAAVTAHAAGDAAAFRTSILRRRIARLARLQAAMRAEAGAEGGALAALGPKAYLRVAREADEALHGTARASAQRRAAMLGLNDWAARMKAWQGGTGAAAERVADARTARTRLALGVAWARAFLFFAGGLLLFDPPPHTTLSFSFCACNSGP